MMLGPLHTQTQELKHNFPYLVVGAFVSSTLGYRLRDSFRAISSVTYLYGRSFSLVVLPFICGRHFTVPTTVLSKRWLFGTVISA